MGIYRCMEITYPAGVTVNMDEVHELLKDYLDQLQEEGVDAIGSGLRRMMKNRTYNKTLHEYFVDADNNENGILSWNDKEIFEFCMLCFERIGLPRPRMGDPMFHALYHKFDLDNSGSLSERECLCMMDSVIRVICRAQRKTDPASSSDDAEFF